MSTERACADIFYERRRQVIDGHHTPAQDDEQVNGELARAAASRALRAVRDLFPFTNPAHAVYDHRARLLWPFARGEETPQTPRRNLVIAAALLVAEIERLDRAAARALALGEGKDA